MLFFCAIRAVPSAIGGGNKRLFTGGAKPFPITIKQSCFQRFIQGKNSYLEPAAEQRERDTLYADAFRPIVQQDAMAAVIVAALSCQLVHLTVLLIIHDDKSLLWIRMELFNHA